MFVSIKEYAESKGISYESVRRQIPKYEKELNGHIVKRNNTRYLDEYAVSFLNTKRGGYLFSATIQPMQCPFCGWGTIVEAYMIGHGCMCNSCNAKTARYKTWDEAVKAWNNRV